MLFSLLGAGTVGSEISAIAASAYAVFKTIVNIILPVLAGFVIVLGVIFLIRLSKV